MSEKLVRKCEEIRRIWQGPGPQSYELRVAMEEMFALLPEQEPALTVRVKDSLAARSTFGGQ